MVSGVGSEFCFPQSCACVNDDVATRLTTPGTIIDLGPIPYPGGSGGGSYHVKNASIPSSSFPLSGTIPFYEKIPWNKEDPYDTSVKVDIENICLPNGVVQQLVYAGGCNSINDECVFALGNVEKGWTKVTLGKGEGVCGQEEGWPCCTEGEQCRPLGHLLYCSNPNDPSKGTCHACGFEGGICCPGDQACENNGLSCVNKVCQRK